MKKVILMVLVLVLVLICVNVTACGKGIKIDGPGDIHISNPDGNGDINIQGGSKTPENFGDIPIYPGSTQLYKITGEEEMDGKPAILDHRIYSTSDNFDKVVSFYKTQMPANGWTEESWVEASMITMGTYNKAEKQSFAVIAVGAADAQVGTNITIDKKYLK